MPESTTPTTISFKCPHCGHETAVESKFAGHSGPCASCSNTITIPTQESLRHKPAVKPKKASMSWGVKTGIAIGVVTAIGLIGILCVSVVRPVFKAAREAAECVECESNLIQIGRALDDYYDTHGNYPPATVLDENGTVMHSWRVLLLPHLGPDAQKLYAKYDMSNPWDSRENLLLASKIPKVYRCPSDSGIVSDDTSYLAVVGDRTVINKEHPTERTGDGPFVLKDRPGETLVIIESTLSGVNWLEPIDIPVAALRAGLNSKNAAAPGSTHSHGINTLMADGSVIRLPDYTTWADLRGMATIDGDDEYIEVLDEVLYAP